MDENTPITDTLPESIAGQEKIWYGIGETAEALGVPASTLRFWEKEFDMIKPRKTRKATVSIPKTTSPSCAPSLISRR